MLTIEDGQYILEPLGSGDDPIFYKGKETTPNNLCDDYERDTGKPRSEMDIRKLHIKYYRMRDDCIKPVRGTLYSMILDRLRGLSRE